MPPARGIPPRTMSTVWRERRRGAPLLPSPDPGGAVRQWRYQTRPVFKRVREPLVDVFHEAEEVLIVVDLGGFSRGEIALRMRPERYVIEARRGELAFREEIDLPPNVDVARARERLVNGLLEIVLPRRRTGARG